MEEKKNIFRKGFSFPESVPTNKNDKDEEKNLGGTTIFVEDADEDEVRELLNELENK